MRALPQTATVLHSLILACIIFPEWVKSAQEELDRVVGKDRLPTFQDRPNLPFMEAVVRGKSYPDFLVPNNNETD